MVDLGTLEIGLKLDKATLERDINKVRSDLAKVGRSIPQINIKPFVDHQPLTELNAHLEKKVKHLKEVNAYFRNNPVKVIYGYEGDFGSSQTLSSGSSVVNHLVSNSFTDDLESKVSKGFGNVEGKLDSLINSIDKLTKAVKSTKTGLFGKTIGKVFEGFFLGAGAKTGMAFGTGLEGGLGYNFQGIGESTGRDIRKKVRRARKLADFGLDNFFNIPNGVDTLKELTKDTIDAIYNTLVSPRTFKAIEDAIVDYQQLSQERITIPDNLRRLATKKDASPEHKAKYESLLKQQQEVEKKIQDNLEANLKKIYRPFLNIAEDAGRVAFAAGMGVISQPIRFMKRVELARQARMVRNQAKIYQEEYSRPNTFSQINDAEAITLVVGGVQPQQSTESNTEVGSTYDLANVVKSRLPHNFVEPVTPYMSNNLRELKDSPSMWVKQQLIPQLEDKDSPLRQVLSKFASDDEIRSAIGQLKMAHPMDRVVQTNLRAGYDQDAVKLATKVYSLLKQFPNKPISLVGGSGGGYVVEQAIGILNQIGKLEPEFRKLLDNVYGYGLGTPISGLTKVHDSELRSGKKAKYVSFLGGKDHIGYAMFNRQILDMVFPDMDEQKKQQAIEEMKQEAVLSFPEGVLRPDPKTQVPTISGDRHAVQIMALQLMEGREPSASLKTLELFGKYPQIETIEQLKQDLEKLKQIQSRLQKNPEQNKSQISQVKEAIEQYKSALKELLNLPGLNTGINKHLVKFLDSITSDLSSVLSVWGLRPKSWSKLLPLNISDDAEVEKILKLDSKTDQLEREGYLDYGGLGEGGRAITPWSPLSIVKPNSSLIKTAEYENFIKAFENLYTQGVLPYGRLYEFQKTSTNYNDDAPKHPTTPYPSSPETPTPEGYTKLMRFREALYHTGLGITKDDKFSDILAKYNSAFKNKKNLTATEQAVKQFIESYIALFVKDNQLFQQEVAKISQDLKQGNIQSLLTTEYFKISSLLNDIILSQLKDIEYDDNNLIKSASLSEKGSSEATKVQKFLNKTPTEYLQFLKDYYNAVLTFEGLVKNSKHIKSKEAFYPLLDFISSIQDIQRELNDLTTRGISSSIKDDPFILGNLLKLQEEFPEIDLKNAQYLGQGYTAKAVRVGDYVVKMPHTEVGIEKVATEDEIGAMQALNPQNVGQGHYAPRFIGKSSGQGFDKALLMTFIEGKSVEKLISESSDGGLTEGLRKEDSQIAFYIKKMGQLLRTIHESGYTHNDLNPANVLVTDSGNFVAIDFANAQKIKGTSQQQQEQIQRDINRSIQNATRFMDKDSAELFQKLFKEGYAKGILRQSPITAKPSPVKLKVDVPEVNTSESKVSTKTVANAKKQFESQVFSPIWLGQFLNTNQFNPKQPQSEQPLPVSAQESFQAPTSNIPIELPQTKSGTIGEQLVTALQQLQEIKTALIQADSLIVKNDNDDGGIAKKQDPYDPNNPPVVRIDNEKGVSSDKKAVEVKSADSKNAIQKQSQTAVEAFQKTLTLANQTYTNAQKFYSGLQWALGKTSGIIAPLYHGAQTLESLAFDFLPGASTAKGVIKGSTPLLLGGAAMHLLPSGLTETAINLAQMGAGSLTQWAGTGLSTAISETITTGLAGVPFGTSIASGLITPITSAIGSTSTLLGNALGAGAIYYGVGKQIQNGLTGLFSQVRLGNPEDYGFERTIEQIPPDQLPPSSEPESVKTPLYTLPDQLNNIQSVDDFLAFASSKAQGKSGKEVQLMVTKNLRALLTQLRKDYKYVEGDTAKKVEKLTIRELSDSLRQYGLSQLLETMMAMNPKALYNDKLAQIPSGVAPINPNHWIVKATENPQIVGEDVTRIWGDIKRDSQSGNVTYKQVTNFIAHLSQLQDQLRGVGGRIGQSFSGIYQQADELRKRLEIQERNFQKLNSFPIPLAPLPQLSVPPRPLLQLPVSPVPEPQPSVDKSLALKVIEAQEALIREIAHQVSEVNSDPRVRTRENSLWMSVNDIQVNPQGLQYKKDGVNTKTGASGSISPSSEWNEQMAGTIAVWKDSNTDQFFVVNGHNRLAHAKSKGVKEVKVEIIDAPTVEAARALGALKNISEGQGKVRDASDYFRSIGAKTIADIQKLGFTPDTTFSRGGGTVKDALGLAQLGDDLYKIAGTPRLSLSLASAIGLSGAKKGKEQQDLLKYFREKGKGLSGEELGEVAQQMAVLMRSGGTVTKKVQQGDLFSLLEGTDPYAQEFNLLFEQAKAIAYVQKQFKLNKKLARQALGTAKSGKYVIDGQSIDVKQAQTDQEKSDLAIRYLNQFKGLDSPITNAINQAARKILDNNGVISEEIGKELIAGVLQGIAEESAKINKATSSDIADPLIEGTKGALGISSPSKVFMEIGRNIMLGLEKGLSSSNILEKFPDKIKQMVAASKLAKLKIEDEITGDGSGVTRKELLSSSAKQPVISPLPNQTYQSNSTKLLDNIKQNAVKAMLGTLAFGTMAMGTPVFANELSKITVDPATTRLELYSGWNREQEAFKDKNAIAFASGPMFSLWTGSKGVPFDIYSDIYQDGKLIVKSPNRAAVEQRAFLGLTKTGEVKFGYGGFKDEYRKEFEFFMSGLHALYNDEVKPPSSYTGGYRAGKQKFKYEIPRQRVAYAKDKEGKLSVVRSEQNVTPKEFEKQLREQGYVAAYLPDHGTKSRLIIPGVRQDNMVGQGDVPYMIRFSTKTAKPQVDTKPQVDVKSLQVQANNASNKLHELIKLFLILAGGALSLRYAIPKTSTPKQPANLPDSSTEKVELKEGKAKAEPPVVSSQSTATDKTNLLQTTVRSIQRAIDVKNFAVIDKIISFIASSSPNTTAQAKAKQKLNSLPDKSYRRLGYTEEKLSEAIAKHDFEKAIAILQVLARIDRKYAEELVEVKKYQNKFSLRKELAELNQSLVKAFVAQDFDEATRILKELVNYDDKYKAELQKLESIKQQQQVEPEFGSEVSGPTNTGQLSIGKGQQKRANKKKNKQKKERRKFRLQDKDFDDYMHFSVEELEQLKTPENEKAINYVIEQKQRQPISRPRRHNPTNPIMSDTPPSTNTQPIILPHNKKLEALKQKLDEAFKIGSVTKQVEILKRLAKLDNQYIAQLETALKEKEKLLAQGKLFRRTPVSEKDKAELSRNYIVQNGVGKYKTPTEEGYGGIRNRSSVSGMEPKKPRERDGKPISPGTMGVGFDIHGSGQMLIDWFKRFLTNKQSKPAWKAVDNAAIAVEDFLVNTANSVPSIKNIYDGIKEVFDLIRQESPQIGRALNFVKDGVIAAFGTAGIWSFREAISAVIRDTTKAYLAMEQIELGIKFSQGSSARAKLRELREQSRKFGLDYETVGRGYAKLAIASKDTAIEPQLDFIFKGFIESFKTRQVSPEAQARAFLALEQMISKEKVSAEELRLQLSEAIPGAMGVGARAMGVSGMELADLLQSGNLTASQFLARFSAQLQLESSAVGPVTQNSLQASVNRLRGEIFEGQALIGQALIPVSQTAIDGLSTALKVLNKGAELVKAGLIGLGIALTKVLLPAFTNVLVNSGAMTVALRLLGIEYSRVTKTVYTSASATEIARRAEELYNYAKANGAPITTLRARRMAISELGRSGQLQTLGMGTGLLAVAKGFASLAASITVTVGGFVALGLAINMLIEALKGWGLLGGHNQETKQRIEQVDKILENLGKTDKDRKAEKEKEKRRDLNLIRYAGLAGGIIGGGLMAGLGFLTGGTTWTQIGTGVAGGSFIADQAVKIITGKEVITDKNTGEKTLVGRDVAGYGKGQDYKNKLTDLDKETKKVIKSINENLTTDKITNIQEYLKKQESNKLEKQALIVAEKNKANPNFDKITKLSEDIAKIDQETAKFIESKLANVVDIGAVKENIELEIKTLKEHEKEFRSMWGDAEYQRLLNEHENNLVKVKAAIDSLNQALKTSENLLRQVVFGFGDINRELANNKFKETLNTGKETNVVKEQRAKGFISGYEQDKRLNQIQIASLKRNLNYVGKAISEMELEFRKFDNSDMRQLGTKLKSHGYRQGESLLGFFKRQSPEALGMILQEMSAVGNQDDLLPAEKQLIEQAQRYLGLLQEQVTIKGQILDLEIQNTQLERDRRLSLRDFRRRELDLLIMIDNAVRQRAIELQNLLRQQDDQLTQNRLAVRSILQSYVDLNVQVNRRAIELKNNLEQVKRNIQRVELGLRLSQLANPGDGLFNGFIDIVDRIAQAFDTYKTEEDNIDLQVLDAEQQRLQIARQVRDIQEQIYNYELQRLRQAEDLVLAHENFIKNQAQTWLQIERTIEDMQEDARQMGQDFQAIAYTLDAMNELYSQLYLRLSRLATQVGSGSSSTVAISGSKTKHEVILLPPQPIKLKNNGNTTVGGSKSPWAKFPTAQSISGGSTATRQSKGSTAVNREQVKKVEIGPRLSPKVSGNSRIPIKPAKEALPLPSKPSQENKKQSALHTPLPSSRAVGVTPSNNNSNQKTVKLNSATEEQRRHRMIEVTTGNQYYLGGIPIMRNVEVFGRNTYKDRIIAKDSLTKFDEAVRKGEIIVKLDPKTEKILSYITTTGEASALLSNGKFRVPMEFTGKNRDNVTKLIGTWKQRIYSNTTVEPPNNFRKFITDTVDTISEENLRKKHNWVVPKKPDIRKEKEKEKKNLRSSLNFSTPIEFEPTASIGGLQLVQKGLNNQYPLSVFPIENSQLIAQKLPEKIDYRDEEWERIKTARDAMLWLNKILKPKSIRDMVALFSFESGTGNFSTSNMGGYKNQYQGYAQLSPDAREKLGVTKGISHRDYALAVARYFLEFRGGVGGGQKLKPGADLQEIYEQINPGFGNVRPYLEKGGHFERADKLLGDLSLENPIEIPEVKVTPIPLRKKKISTLGDLTRPASGKQKPSSTTPNEKKTTLDKKKTTITTPKVIEIVAPKTTGLIEKTKKQQVKESEKLKRLSESVDNSLIIPVRSDVFVDPRTLSKPVPLLPSDFDKIKQKEAQNLDNNKGLTQAKITESVVKLSSELRKLVNEVVNLRRRLEDEAKTMRLGMVADQFSVEELIFNSKGGFVTPTEQGIMTRKRADAETSNKINELVDKISKTQRDTNFNEKGIAETKKQIIALFKKNKIAVPKGLDTDGLIKWASSNNTLTDNSKVLLEELLKTLNTYSELAQLAPKYIGTLTGLIEDLENNREAKNDLAQRQAEITERKNLLSSISGIKNVIGEAMVQNRGKDFFKGFEFKRAGAISSLLAEREELLNPDYLEQLAKFHSEQYPEKPPLTVEALRSEIEEGLANKQQKILFDTSGYAEMKNEFAQLAEMMNAIGGQLNQRGDLLKGNWLTSSGQSLQVKIQANDMRLSLKHLKKTAQLAEEEFKSLASAINDFEKNSLAKLAVDNNFIVAGLVDPVKNAVTGVATIFIDKTKSFWEKVNDIISNFLTGIATHFANNFSTSVTTWVTEKLAQWIQWGVNNTATETLDLTTAKTLSASGVLLEDSARDLWNSSKYLEIVANRLATVTGVSKQATGGGGWLGKVVSNFVSPLASIAFGSIVSDIGALSGGLLSPAVSSSIFTNANSYSIFDGMTVGSWGTGGLVKNFAKGGLVEQAQKALAKERLLGGGKAVLAALTVGEYVVPKNPDRSDIANLFASVPIARNMKLENYARGGVVGRAGSSLGPITTNNSKIESRNNSFVSNIYVTASDANSFRKTKHQLEVEENARIARASRRF